MKCGSNKCLCKPWEEDDIPTYLSSSPVKILKILKFGDVYEDENMDKMMKQVEYFLETMPNLEQLVIYYETSIDEDVVEVFSQFQMVPREGLTKCNIQVISDNLSLSSTSACFLFIGEMDFLYFEKTFLVSQVLLDSLMSLFTISKP